MQFDNQTLNGRRRWFALSARFPGKGAYIKTFDGRMDHAVRIVYKHFCPVEASAACAGMESNVCPSCPEFNMILSGQ
jgi:hypothetical protein